MLSFTKHNPSTFVRVLIVLIAHLSGTHLNAYVFSITPPDVLGLVDGPNGLVQITTGTFNLTGLIGYNQQNPQGVVILDPLSAFDDITRNATIGSGIRMGILEIQDDFDVLRFTGFFDSSALVNQANFEGIVGVIGPAGPSPYTIFLPANTTQPLRTQITSLNEEILADNIDVFVEVGLLLDQTIDVAPSVEQLTPGAEIFQLNPDPNDGKSSWFVGIGGPNDPGGSNGGGGTATLNRTGANMKIHGILQTGGCIAGSLCTATWIGGVGDWNTAGNWDIGIVPFNGNFFGSTFNVIIDASSSNSIVTLLQDVTITNLTVNSGDQLILHENLRLPGGMQFTGGGEIILSDDLAEINIFIGSGDFVNVDNTIQGFGNIAVSLVNENVIRAENGTLILNATDNTGGSIEILSSGILNAMGSGVTGGPISGSAGSRTIGRYTDVTLSGTHTITTSDMSVVGTLSNQNVLTFENDINTGTTETLWLRNQVILNGGGEVILNSADAQIQQSVGVGGLVNVDNTIRGIGNIFASLANQSIVRVEGGTLSLYATDNSSGVIEIEAGAHLNAPSSGVTGGQIVGTPGATLEGLYTDVTLSGTHTITTSDMSVVGTLSNQNVLTFENDINTGTTETLWLRNQVILNGGGEVILNSADAQIQQSVGVGGLVNVDNTIRGIGNIFASLANQSIVRVEGGTLFLHATDNNSGVIEIDTNNHLSAPGSGVTGGQIVGALGTTIEGSYTDVTLLGTHTITTAGMLVGGTSSNQGVLTFENDTNTNATEDLRLVGQLTLNGGGDVIMNSPDARIVQWSGSGGIVNVDNTIRGLGSVSAVLDNRGLVRAEGGLLTINSAVDTDSSGSMEAASDAILALTGTIAENRIVVEAGGQCNFTGSTMQVETLEILPGGFFDFSGTRLEVFEFLGNFFHDSGTFAPGHSIAASLIDGLYIFSGGTLEVELGGITAGTTHDTLHITETMHLNGLLSVKLVNGFVPDPNDTFKILTTDIPYSGAFSNALDDFTGQGLLTIPEGSFIVQYDPNSITLFDFVCIGDSDNDGVCNSLDLCPGFDDAIDADGDTIPDQCDMLPGCDDRADLDADSIIDLFDFAILESDFGCINSDCAADINGDGITNFEDLILMVTDWTCF